MTSPSYRSKTNTHDGQQMVAHMLSGSLGPLVAMCRNAQCKSSSDTTLQALYRGFEITLRLVTYKTSNVDDRNFQFGRGVWVFAAKLSSCSEPRKDFFSRKSWSVLAKPTARYLSTAFGTSEWNSAPSESQRFSHFGHLSWIYTVDYHICLHSLIDVCWLVAPLIQLSTDEGLGSPLGPCLFSCK